MDKVICSRARKCNLSTSECYHKKSHDENEYCPIHNCNFDGTTHRYNIGINGADNFSCIRIIYINEA